MKTRRVRGTVAAVAAALAVAAGLGLAWLAGSFAWYVHVSHAAGAMGERVERLPDRAAVEAALSREGWRRVPAPEDSTLLPEADRRRGHSLSRYDWHGQMILVVYDRHGRRVVSAQHD